MNRNDALNSVMANVENQNMVKHMLATEAVMRALARRFGQEEEEWGLAGLLHDIDVELTEGDFPSHGQRGADLAKELGAPSHITHAILCHNYIHGVPRETLLDKALYCADPLTGLITASALVRPDKKLAGLTTPSVMKHFRQARFAAGANREQMSLCSEIGLELEEFVSIGVEAMQGIADDLGL